MGMGMRFYVYCERDRESQRCLGRRVAAPSLCDSVCTFCLLKLGVDGR